MLAYKLKHHFILKAILKFCNNLQDSKAIPHFWKFDNSSVIARQNVRNIRVALAAPVLQCKKPRCGG